MKLNSAPAKPKPAKKAAPAKQVREFVCVCVCVCVCICIFINVISYI